MGKELDLLGVRLFRSKNGHFQNRVIYKNSIDGKTYIIRHFKFVEVILKNRFYMEKESEG